jgi:hypothetical protein
MHADGPCLHAGGLIAAWWEGLFGWTADTKLGQHDAFRQLILLSLLFAGTLYLEQYCLLY